MCARSRPTLCENSAVGCHFLLQSILLTQGLNPPLLCLLHGPADSLPVATPRKPHVIKKLQQRASSLNIQRIFVIKKKKQISQEKEFSAFLCMRRHKGLGSLKSSFSYAPQLCGQYPVFFHILSSLGAHPKEWLQSDSC